MTNAVRIHLSRADDGVWVEFSDQGREFDPASAPPPDLDSPLESRRVGGLGVHLVGQLMSDIRYQRSGGWNRITMRRPIPAVAPERPETR
jgi:anti-sigma regulatory factor (Ser/Thr protein kinase)